MEETKKESFFKKKKVVAFIAVFAGISGFFFLNKSITGNAVSSQGYSVNVVSLIGLLLVFCAGILVFYGLKKA